jgi:hypothetical protein
MKTRVRGTSDDEMLEKFPIRGRTPGWFFRVASPTGGPCLDLAKSGDPTDARQRLLYLSLLYIRSGAEILAFQGDAR